MTGSDLEEALAFQLRLLDGPRPEREYLFAPPRRWKADFAWPDARLLVEVEGGQWSGGRHLHPTGWAKDVEKYNAAALDGWTVLRVTASMIDDGTAIDLIARALHLPTPGATR